nr:MAG: ORF1 [TTV-like mini virus]
MPYYWRQRFYYPRRRRFRRRRIRKTFRRRWRRLPYRRRNWVRRTFRKKLTKIKLYEFQPRTIKRCKIIGNMCLFQGSPLRSIFNYTQYLMSYVPFEEPGGGGYFVIAISLASLWEDFEHLRNVWTTSNAALPLVRYMGCTFHFYQSQYTDYAVEINNCFPMKDFKYTHADIAPNRMLLKKNAIIVPSLETRRRKKPYKKVRVRPPPQFQNKWYFQKDICEIPLVMLLGTAIDLRYPYGGSSWESNNITLTCLNPEVFHYHNFKNPSATTGYYPKENTYLYALHTGSSHTPTADSTYVYLGNSKDNQEGKPKKLSELKNTNMSDWGNMFYHRYIDGSYKIYASTKPPSTIQNTDYESLIEYTTPYFIRVRYNPERDTGEGNQLYLTPNFMQSSWDPPAPTSNTLYSGFPLFDLIWGYLDWQEKIHEVQNILETYMVTIRTSYMKEKLTMYVPVDQEFIDGFSAYKDETSVVKVTPNDQISWYPKAKFQLKTLNALGLSGPACCRPHYNNYIQARMKYFFHFKWGGCPKTLEKPYDPCSQPDWTIPRNLYEGLQIENPGTAPETILQSFDWNRDYIKTKAIERIKKHTKTDDSLQIVSESKRSVPAMYFTEKAQTSDSETSEEESKTSLQEQIHNLRLQQRILKRQLLKQLTRQSIE